MNKLVIVDLPREIELEFEDCMLDDVNLSARYMQAMRNLQNSFDRWCNYCELPCSTIQSEHYPDPSTDDEPHIKRNFTRAFVEIEPVDLAALKLAIGEIRPARDFAYTESHGWVFRFEHT